jgi:hypothetical protein
MPRYVLTFLLLAFVACQTSAARSQDEIGAVVLDLPPQCLAPTAPPFRAAAIPPLTASPWHRGIVGVVTDARSGGALHQALSEVLSPSRASRWTDSTGGFYFDSLPSDSVVVRVRRLGYEPQLATLRLRAGYIDTLRVALLPAGDCNR